MPGQFRHSPSMVTPIPTTLAAFKEYFDGLIVDCDKGRCSSVPVQALQGCMTLEVIKKLLEQHDVTDSDARLCSAISCNYRVVFVIMILIEKGSDISSIIRLAELGDDKLPFRLNTSECWPLGDQCFLEFYNKQWLFCGIRWEEKTLDNRKFEDSSVLPIRAIVEEKHYTNSTMRCIDLWPEYNGLNSETNIFALKTSDDMTNEIKCYQILMGQAAILDNLVTAYGSYSHMKREYLVLDYIDGGTLEELFVEAPPQPTQWLQFWKSLAGAFNPLKRIHSLEHNGQLLHATHQDVKPANIMFSPKYNGDFSKTLFKLIDFASTEFEKGVYVENKKVRTGETQMFSAPEICRTDPVLQTDPMSVGWKIDTWSFGAVLSETLVWCTRGPEGLTRYRQNRASELSHRTELYTNGYGTCFHNGRRVLDSVIKMHVEALAASDDHLDTKVLVKGIIALSEKMLTEQAIRPTDKDVYDQFSELFRRYGHQNQFFQQALDAHELRPRRPRPQRHVEHTTISEGASISTLAGVESRFEDGHSSAKGKKRDIVVEPQNSSRSPQRIPLQIDPGTKENKIESLPISGQNGRVVDDMLSASRVGVQTPLRDTSATPSALSAQLSSDVRTSANTNSIQAVLKWVDEHKKDKDATPQLPGHEQLQQLKGREKMFVIDTSDSMGRCWCTSDGVVRVFDALGYLVKDYALGKMKMFILDSKQSVLEVGKDRRIFREALLKRLPEGQGNLPRDFKQILENWWDQNESWVKSDKFLKPDWRYKIKKMLAGANQESIVRGLDAYILTDGNWQTSDGPSAGGIDKAIKRLFKKLDSYGAPPSTVRIHFIHFSHDPRDPEVIKGLANLQAINTAVDSVLAEEQVACVTVDIEPHTGNVWNMLIGPSS
ncbi:hypothetical protein IQ06DRAFT_332072 [Phaeosphaeriaceae sp. SRC1lsM3a]|nr:hypothetical protein IQ06DRAFT_332072 [Stagonospora sp. SRC1lsM3a]